MWLLRGLGLFIGIACLVWVSVLWYWQNTHRDMSGSDIAVYLGALPLTVFTLVVLGRWAWKGASAKAFANPPTEAPSAVDAGSQTRTATAAAKDSQATGARLLAAQLCCPAGASVEELMQSASAGRPRPDLNTALLDKRGLPVIVAEVKDLSTQPVRRALLELQALQPSLLPPGVPQEPSEGLVRALALLEAPLKEAVDSMKAWPEPLGPGPSLPGQTQHPEQPVQHHVRVLAAWPEPTTPAEQRLAEAWVARQLLQWGEGVVDPRAWLPPVSFERAAGRTIGPLLWQHAEHLLSALRSEQRDDVVLLIASHSDIHPAAIDRLDQAGRLFGASCPTGEMPGEAAAVLVLANPLLARPGAASPHGTGPQSARLSAAQVVQADATAHAARGGSAEGTARLIADLLASAGLPAEDVAGLASDGDQHSGRAKELFGALLAALPHLDAVQDHCMAGPLCGRTGAVGTLIAAALAAHRATASGSPHVALSLGDPEWRLALLAGPDLPSSTDAPGTAPAAAQDPQPSS